MAILEIPCAGCKSDIEALNWSLPRDGGQDAVHRDFSSATIESLLTHILALLSIQAG